MTGAESQCSTTSVRRRPLIRKTYETVLGLSVQAVGGPEPGNPDLRGRVVYRAGAGTMLSIHERPISPAEHTAAFFVEWEPRLRLAA